MRDLPVGAKVPRECSVEPSCALPPFDPFRLPPLHQASDPCSCTYLVGEHRVPVGSVGVVLSSPLGFVMSVIMIGDVVVFMGGVPEKRTRQTRLVLTLIHQVEATCEDVVLTLYEGALQALSTGPTLRGRRRLCGCWTRYGWRWWKKS